MSMAVVCHMPSKSVPLNYASAGPSDSNRASFRLARKTVATVITLGASYFLAGYRTEYFGFSVGRGLLVPVAVAGGFLAPTSVLLYFLTCTERVFARALAMTITLLIISVVVSELWAGCEEWSVMRSYGAKPRAALLINRRWPFRDNQIGFDPGYGWYAHD